MEARIATGYLQSLGFSGNEIFLNDPQCHPQKYGNWLIFYIPYDECGTIRQVRWVDAKYKSAIYDFIHPYLKSAVE